MHDDESVQTGPQVVDYYSDAFWQSLQLTHRRWLQNIEDTKKYKAREKSFPSKRDSNQRDQLTCDFVDHHKLRIFQARRAPSVGSSGDSYERCRNGGRDSRPGTSLQRDAPAHEVPQDHRDDRSPCARTRLKAAYAA